MSKSFKKEIVTIVCTLCIIVLISLNMSQTVKLNQRLSNLEQRLELVESMKIETSFKRPVNLTPKSEFTIKEIPFL